MRLKKELVALKDELAGYEELKSRYDYEQLTASLNLLKDRYDRLKVDSEKLLSNYDTMRNEFQSLLSAYDDLKSRYKNSDRNNISALNFNDSITWYNYLFRDEGDQTQVRSN